MTRDELLQTAKDIAKVEGIPPFAEEFRGMMLHGILCVLLAAEMRHTIGIAETIRSYEGGGKK
jgi:hypothetical protein